MISKSTTIHIATDHAGLDTKDAIRDWLSQEGFTVRDHGAHDFDPEDDFSDFISVAAKAVAESEGEVGVVFGGSGQGEAMMANRFKGVRATVFYGGSEEIVSLSRTHNDANMLSIGARFVSLDQAKKVIWDWLHADVIVAEKYQRRNEKLDSLS